MPTSISSGLASPSLGSVSVSTAPSSAATIGHAKLSLGASGDFALLAGSSITFSSSLTVIASGSVGLSAGGMISGKYLLNGGTTETGTSGSNAGMAAFTSLQTAASDETCTSTISSNLSGVSLGPGVYCSISGSFSLDEWSSCYQ